MFLSPYCLYLDEPRIPSELHWTVSRMESYKMKDEGSDWISWYGSVHLTGLSHLCASVSPLDSNVICQFSKSLVLCLHSLRCGWNCPLSRNQKLQSYGAATTDSPSCLSIRQSPHNCSREPVKKGPHFHFPYTLDAYSCFDSIVVNCAPVCLYGALWHIGGMCWKFLERSQDSVW